MGVNRKGKRSARAWNAIDPELRILLELQFGVLKGVLGLKVLLASDIVLQVQVKGPEP